MRRYEHVSVNIPSRDMGLPENSKNIDVSYVNFSADNRHSNEAMTGSSFSCALKQTSIFLTVHEPSGLLRVRITAQIQRRSRS